MWRGEARILVEVWRHRWCSHQAVHDGSQTVDGAEVPISRRWRETRISSTRKQEGRKEGYIKEKTRFQREKKRWRIRKRKEEESEDVRTS